MIGGAISIYSLVIVSKLIYADDANKFRLNFQEKSKAWKFSWLIHQGISIEIIIILLYKCLMSSALLLGLAIPFIFMKLCSWFAVVSAIKVLKFEESRKKFAVQWIENSIFVTPNFTMTFPVPDLIQSHEKY